MIAGMLLDGIIATLHNRRHLLLALPPHHPNRRVAWDWLKKSLWLLQLLEFLNYLFMLIAEIGKIHPMPKSIQRALRNTQLPQNSYAKKIDTINYLNYVLHFI